QNKDKHVLDKEKVAILINALRADFDYILIDSPAGIESGFEHAVLYADMALVVVTPEVSSLRDSDRVIGIIDAKSDWAKKGKEVHKYLIINRIKPELVRSGEMIPTEEVLKILGLPLIGMIPEDSHIISATNKGEPVIRTDCESAKA
ncbi:septum site-determining protein MinD, partial [Helicobacter pylori]